MAADNDIFKLLMRGARFDKKKFSEDVEIFEHPSDHKLDFFGEKRGEKSQVLDESSGEVARTEFTAAEMEEMQRRAKKEKKIRVYGDNVPKLVLSFQEIFGSHGLCGNVQKALSTLGCSEPSPVQMQAIPIMLERSDLIGCAPTGSGKTLAFVLPIIARLKEHRADGIRSVIIAPTVELAQQTSAVIKFLCGKDSLKVLLMKKDFRGAMKKKHYDVLVTTPLRLVSAIEEKQIDLSKVELLVLDEADKLMEKSFLSQLDAILAACTSKNIQKALFSATISSGVEQLANTFLKEPCRVVVGERNAATDTIDQKLVYTTNEEGKLMAFKQLIRAGIKPPVLVFMESIEKADELFHQLVYEGIHVDVISSKRTRDEREQIIRDFHSGKTWVLIATDLIARGVDFKGVNCVINYDFPDSVASYIHRIGRTGRAGQKGRSITFFTDGDVEKLRGVANVMKAGGCEFPQWILNLKKTKNKKRRRPGKPKPAATAAPSKERPDRPKKSKHE